MISGLISDDPRSRTKIFYDADQNGHYYKTDVSPYFTQFGKKLSKMKTVLQFLALTNAASPMQVIILELSSRGP